MRTKDIKKLILERHKIIESLDTEHFTTHYKSPFKWLLIVIITEKRCAICYKSHVKRRTFSCRNIKMQLFSAEDILSISRKFSFIRVKEKNGYLKR